MSAELPLASALRLKSPPRMARPALMWASGDALALVQSAGADEDTTTVRVAVVAFPALSVAV
jgi:hypothetical protein